MDAAVEAIEALARRQQVPARPQAMTQVRQPRPAWATVVDFWWQGVGQDGESCVLSPRWRQGIQAYRLPLVSWAHHVAHPRCPPRKAKRVQALDAVRTAFDTHTSTPRLAPPVRADWHAWATERVNVLQRVSSAVAGRHGSLSHRHHKQRGGPKRRDKVWAVLPNCDGRAADGTPPAARFLGQSFPDLVATVLSHIDDLPRPRKRNQAMALPG